MMKQLAVANLPSATHSRSCALLGFPFHEGTVRNQGQPGAEDGPSVFRKYCSKMGSLRNLEFGIDISDRVDFFDCGDVSGATLEEAHVNLRREVSAILSKGHVPIVIGGSNDQSYPNARALMDNLDDLANLTVINLDAHLDVRELLSGGLAHSGSPFYQLLTDEDWKGSFIEFGAQGHQCGESHVNFVHSHGGSITWYHKDLRGELQRKHSVPEIFQQNMTATGKENWFVSFDIDCISNAYLESVSCSSGLGITAHEAIDICRYSGSRKEVRLIDFSEFNPRIGNQEKSARLLSTMVYYFLLGLAQRE